MPRILAAELGDAALTPPLLTAQLSSYLEKVREGSGDVYALRIASPENS